MLHCFGPDHIRLTSVDSEGKLTARPERYSVNTQDKTDRVTTSATLSPDERFLLVGNIMDERPSTNPDGSLNEITSVSIPYNSPQGLAAF